MPPPLKDYRSIDWLRLRPILHRIKTMRYRAMDRRFRALAPRTGDIRQLGSRLRGRQVLISVAFSDPQTIAWQAPLVQLYSPNAVYVVADNTPDDGQAAAIEQVARSASVPYVRLPRNPTSSASRSHGLALNWIWHNLVRPHEPAMFGFLDHDIFPTAPTDPFAPLLNQDFFGVLRPGIATSIDAGDRWFLWAGFSMFRFDAVRHKPLDFSQDWFSGLDTGGANWAVLYRHVDRNRISEQSTTFVPFREGLPMNDAPLQWCGPWLHEVGLMGRLEFAEDKRAAVAWLLSPHLARARARRGDADMPIGDDDRFRN
jgi:hypothetical protein